MEQKGDAWPASRKFTLDKLLDGWQSHSVMVHFKIHAVIANDEDKILLTATVGQKTSSVLRSYFDVASFE